MTISVTKRKRTAASFCQYPWVGVSSRKSGGGEQAIDLYVDYISDKVDEIVSAYNNLTDVVEGIYNNLEDVRERLRNIQKYLYSLERLIDYVL